MINISFEVLEEVEETIKLQNNVFLLDGDTIEDTYKWLLNNDFLFLEKMPNLVSSIFFFIKYRPLKVSYAVELVKKIIGTSPPFIDLILYHFFDLFSNDIDICNTCFYFSFMSTLFRKGLVSKERLIQYYNSAKERYPGCRYHNILFQIWFGPFISSIRESNLYQVLRDESVNIASPYLIFSFLSRALFPFWESLAKDIKRGCFNDEPLIFKYIMEDNLEEIIKMTVDFNQIYFDSIFTPCRLLTFRPNIIQYAAYFGSIKCFKYFMINRANTKSKDASNKTLLQFAIAGGNKEIVRLSLQNVNDTDNCAQVAAEHLHNELAMWFIESQQKITKTVLTEILKSCCLSNNVELFTNLIRTLHMTEIDFTPIIESAIINESMTILRMILSDPKIDPNAQNGLLLKTAVEHHKVPCVRELLSHIDIDITEGKFCALFAAIENGYDDLASVLMSLPECQSNCDLLIDCFVEAAKNVKTLELFKKEPYFHQIKVNCLAENGMNALQFSISKNANECTKMLLEWPDIDINAKNIDGITPTEFCEMYDNLEACNMLLNDQRYRYDEFTLNAASKLCDKMEK